MAYQLQHSLPYSTHTLCPSDLSSYFLLSSNRSTLLFNNSGDLIRTYPPSCTKAVTALSISADNSQFIQGGADKNVPLTDVATGKVIRRLTIGSATNAVKFGKEIVITAGWDSILRMWDLRSQNHTPIQTFSESKDSISTLHLSGSTVTTGGVDGYVRSYDLRMGIMTSDYFKHSVTSVTKSDDDATLLVSTLDSTIRLMDCESGSPDGKCVIAGDESGQIFIWDVLEGTILKQLNAHNKSVLSVQLKNKEMFTAGADGSVKIWSLVD